VIGYSSFFINIQKKYSSCPRAKFIETSGLELCKNIIKKLNNLHFLLDNVKKKWYIVVEKGFLW